ncbi:MAG: DUF58 domain-containing protein [Spirochaetales bacterium]|nr:DUF58 domain-containing protein [Spirochaetales bacterium]
MRTASRGEASSWFTSLGGIICLGVLSVLTAYFHLMNLTVFLLAVLFMALFSFIWGKLSLRSVEVEASAMSCNVFPGEDIRVNISVSNNKAIPVIWINVRYFKNPPVFLSDSSEIEHRVAWLMPRQKATWTTSMQTKRRGIAFMETIGASSGDGFGLCTETLDYPLPKPPMIVVYPKVYPVDAGILVENSSSMLPFDRGCVEDDTLFKGIHDYQHGDSIKHINWRILAHQGELAVNEYQPVIPRLVTFVLDLMSFTTWREEVTNAGSVMVLDSMDAEGMEDMISLTASCILAMTGRKVRCSLVIPAFGKSEMRVIDGNGLDDQIPLLLTELAGLEYMGEECSFHGLGSRSFGLGQIWLVTDKEKPSLPLAKEFPDPWDAGQIIRRGSAGNSARRIIEMRNLRRGDGQDS